jgi:hypothetical protein
MARKQPDWAGGAKAGYRAYQIAETVSVLRQGGAKLKSAAFEFLVLLLAAGAAVLIGLLL